MRDGFGDFMLLPLLVRDSCRTMLLQAATVVARGASGIFTFGIANPLVATAELAGASVASVLAIVAPVIVVLGVVVLAVWLVRRLVRRRPAVAADTGT